MVKKYLKSAAISFIVGIFCAGSIMVVSALTYVSSEKTYYSVNGYDYYNEANTYVEEDGVVGQTVGGPVENVYIPTGYIGCLSRLYDDDTGELLRSSDWHYNFAPCNYSFCVQSGKYYTTSGSYYSKGETRAFNGTDYDTFDTARTVSINK